MSRIARDAASSLAAIALLAGLAGAAGGAAWGWGTLAAGLAALLVHQLVNLARLAGWLAHPVPDEVP